MPFALLLNWRIWAAVTLAVTLAGTHWKAYVAGKHTVEAEWNAERLEMASQAQVLKDAATATTTKLQAETDKLRKAKNAQIAKLDADLADALTSLSYRPNRPDDGGLPAPAGTGQATAGCTGAGLFRSDSELLIRIAGDADQLRIGLQACYQAYDGAREALK